MYLNFDTSRIVELAGKEDTYDLDEYIGSLIEDAYQDGEDHAYDDPDRVYDWILGGDFDNEVGDRAKQLGFTKIAVSNQGDDMLQTIHRMIHPNGPWGYEFCSRC